LKKGVKIAIIRVSNKAMEGLKMPNLEMFTVRADGQMMIDFEALELQTSKEFVEEVKMTVKSFLNPIVKSTFEYVLSKILFEDKNGVKLVRVLFEGCIPETGYVTSHVVEWKSTPLGFERVLWKTVSELEKTLEWSRKTDSQKKYDDGTPVLGIRSNGTYVLGKLNTSFGYWIENEKGMKSYKVKEFEKVIYNPTEDDIPLGFNLK
jgi:hypothetical protein